MDTYEHLTNTDIAWAAGIYEGEGNVAGGYRVGIQVQVTQKNPWILHKLVPLFGGKVTQRKTGMNDWVIYGNPARMFLSIIYQFLSPRRQAEIDEAKDKSPYSRGENPYCKRGHLYDKVYNGKKYCSQCDKIRRNNRG